MDMQPQPAGQAEHQMAVGDVLDHLAGEEFAEEKLPLLRAARAEARLAGEGQQPLRAAVVTANAREAIVEDTAAEKPVPCAAHHAAQGRLSKIILLGTLIIIRRIPTP